MKSLVDRFLNVIKKPVPATILNGASSLIRQLSVQEAKIRNVSAPGEVVSSFSREDISSLVAKYSSASSVKDAYKFIKCYNG